MWFECVERQIGMPCVVHWKKVGAVARSRSLEGLCSSLIRAMSYQIEF